MANSKIQDEREVLRWFEEGRSYSWMQQKYREKYNIETSIGMWGNFRRRHGLELRVGRDSSLIPWKVKREHRWAYPLAMLRAEARVRRGEKLRPTDQDRLPAWKARLAKDDLVVHYDPDTEEGFFLVPRRPGIDNDLIREPERADGVKWGA